jgi:hypothetical protein
VRFLLCLAYLLNLPFHALALAALIGFSALAVTLIGRPGEEVTAAAVSMALAALPPRGRGGGPVPRSQADSRRARAVESVEAARFPRAVRFDGMLVG